MLGNNTFTFGTELGVVSVTSISLWFKRQVESYEMAFIGAHLGPSEAKLSCTQRKHALQKSAALRHTRCIPCAWLPERQPCAPGLSLAAPPATGHRSAPVFTLVSYLPLALCFVDVPLADCCLSKVVRSQCDATAAGAYRLVEYIGTSGAPLSTSDIAKFPAPPDSVSVDFVIAFVGDATSKTTPSGNFFFTGGSFCSGDNLDQDLISALKKVGGGSGVRPLFVIHPLLASCFTARACLQFALHPQACCACGKLFPRSSQTQFKSHIARPVCLSECRVRVTLRAQHLVSSHTLTGNPHCQTFW